MPEDELIDELRAALSLGAVSIDPADLRSRSHDSWPVASKWAQLGEHPYPADVVVRATSAGDVEAVVKIAARRSVPVTPWGRGSSVTGAALPVKGGIVLDLAGLDGAETVDDVNLTVTVPAGVLGSDLEARLNARGLTLGHSPQSLGCSSVGGWLATRASGQFSSKYGSIEDLVLGVTAVLSSGRRVTLTTSPRAALGPDLRQLFIGSEGTLAVITEVVLRIFPVPQHRVLEAFRFDDVTSGIEAMRQITRQGLRPFLVRFYDEDEARHAMQDVGFDGCVLFLGHEGLAALAACEHGLAVEIVERCGATSLGSTAVEAWMLRRFDFSTVEKALNKTGGYAETIEVHKMANHRGPLPRLEAGAPAAR